MTWDPQSFALPIWRDAPCSAPDSEEDTDRQATLAGISVVRRPRESSSETYPATALVRTSNHRGQPESLQIKDLGPAEGSCSFMPAARTHRLPLRDRATHPSRQAFSGRPARITGQAPGASNRPASPQLGGAGPQRPNQPSACQSREQRQTGPRTPLHENEGRPRATYDKKEHTKCSQVEYDSC
jgi:hypothetical protein